MSARHAGRLWLLGGVLAIAVLIAASYLLAIKPVYDDKAQKEGQIYDQNMQLAQLKRTLAKLKAQADDIASYTAQLTARRKELPDNYDIPNFLRQLQDSDGSVRVETNAIGVTAPVAVEGASTVVSLPITVTVTGSTDDLTKFVQRLQTVNRAVLVTSIVLTDNEDDKSTVNLVLTAFCGKNDKDDCTVKAA
jgi:type IV pilus assembly protein PilO